VSPEIVPRWEWRTFGDDFGEADTFFAGKSPERDQESDETYLLSTEGDASVKVRGGLMDVKELQGVDDYGLEQWKPVLKAEFPLGVEEVREDAATPAEGDARIVTGPRYAPVPALDSPWARVTLAAVAAPRARV